jgi:hypothetical protein
VPGGLVVLDPILAEPDHFPHPQSFRPESWQTKESSQEERHLFRAFFGQGNGNNAVGLMGLCFLPKVWRIDRDEGRLAVSNRPGMASSLMTVPGRSVTTEITWPGYQVEKAAMMRRSCRFSSRTKWIRRGLVEGFLPIE